MDENRNPITGTVVTTVDTKVPPVTPVVEKAVTPKVDEVKTISKDLFDKTSKELAEAKRQLKEKMTADEIKTVEALELSNAEKVANETLKAELETLKKQVVTSTLISSTSETRSKIGFAETEKEFADVVETLDYTTLSALINKISNVAYEKGKKDVTDSVMKKTGNLNLSGSAGNEAGDENIENAKRLAKANIKTPTKNSYFTN